MRFKRYIPILIYLLLIVLCLAIVILMGELARPGGGEEESSSVSQEVSPQIPESEETSEPEETKADQEEEFCEETGQGPQHRGGLEEETTEFFEEEKPYVPPVLMLASDLHYISSGMHDDGRAFEKLVEDDDGKVSRYSDVLLDTLTAEAVSLSPSALVLTGDITLNGERENHQRLAEKLRRVKEAGVPVLVIPGNHDIMNQNAATYFGDQREKAEYLETAQDFYELYREFGYDQALSRDEASLSYLYELDDTHWVLMLDTCQYEDYNYVNGRLKTETMEWAGQWLARAAQQGIMVMPAGHHNLLSESRLYTTECTMENHEEIIRLLENYEIPLYISGHLHAQRIKKHKREPGVGDEVYGIQEIVLPPYSIPPCQYGWLEWGEEGDMNFSTRKADVAAYARAQGSDDENLLRFDRYGPEFVKRIMEDQVIKKIHSVPEDLKREMAGLYGMLYYDYCAGNQMSRDGVRATKAYALWQRVDPDNEYVKDMGQMIEDVKQDLHDWRSYVAGYPKRQENGQE